MLATTIPMSFGIMAISDIFVPWYYGDGFEKCSILFQILAPTCIFSAFGTVIRSLYLIPNKKDSIYVISTFLGVIINMIINVLLINSMGSIGASIGVLVAEFTVCLYQTISVWKDLDIKKYLSFSILFLMAGILMYVIIKNFTIMNNSLFITLIINILIGIFIYFTCIILFVYFGYRKRR